MRNIKGNGERVEHWKYLLRFWIISYFIDFQREGWYAGTKNKDDSISCLELFNQAASVTDLYEIKFPIQSKTKVSFPWNK